MFPAQGVRADAPTCTLPVLFALALLFVPLLATRRRHRRPPRSAAPSTIPNRGVLPGVTVTVRNVGTALSRTVATNAEGRYVIAGLAPGAYELRAELAGFKPHVRRDLPLDDRPGPRRQHHPRGRRTERRRDGGRRHAARQHLQLASSAISSASEAIDQLPLNGRNYTDLALLQPGVLAYPHRDGGSVVAHGLGMSVNGQDPRSNVYLLDGTLQNDFTNGPAGSAAGTALGIETVREFRVETNAYSAEFGRNSGGQINVLTKSGTNSFDGSVYEFHRNDALDARNYFDAGEQAGLPPQPVRRHGRRTDRARSRVLLPRLRGARRAARQDGLARSCPTTTRASASCRAASVPRQPGRSRLTSPSIPRANGPSLGQGLAELHVPVRSDARRALRAGPRRLQLRRRHAALRPLHVRRHRPVPADGLSAVPAQLHLAQPVLHRRVPPHRLAEHAQHQRASASAARGSARTSRPTPRSRCRCSSPRATAWATSTSAASGASVRRAPAICAWCRTCSARRTTWSRRAAATCSRPGRWPSTTRTTWSTRPSASASSRSPT